MPSSGTSTPPCRASSTRATRSSAWTPRSKEQIGLFAQAGREWTPPGQPVKVLDHDFPTHACGTAIPYGIYGVGRNTGYVVLGTDHDTAAFAVACLRRWWTEEGRAACPEAKRLLITADGGGSNSSRAKAWKANLAVLATETGLAISVCHLPPGTSSGVGDWRGCFSGR